MSAHLNVVVLGGGTSGWMCGAALASILKAGQPESPITLRLIESSEIGTVGVGEATLPHIKAFNDKIGIDEADFMRKTAATFKLGIRFVDWGHHGSDYIHPFGAYGDNESISTFHHYWTRARLAGKPASLEAYSYAIAASRADKFEFPSEDFASIKSTYSYAYHFDASLYAAYLREFAEARGLERIEGKVVDVRTDSSSGDIRAVILASGESVEGDLFVDCSGFRGLLIGDRLNAGWEDWTRWLPCDRALAVPVSYVDDVLPTYTQSTALEAGWKWQIPLQHRVGTGYVYSSAFISDEAAADRLAGSHAGKMLADPRPLRFKSGRRTASWTKNCIAVGLASGFLEPLESTSIYLSQIAITNLLELFPARQIDPALRDEFNRRVDVEYDRVRDFLILHYHANTRDDGELWAYTRTMPIPDSLVERIEQFRHRGHVTRYRDGLFSPVSWIAVLAGQGILPEGYDRTVDNLTDAALENKLNDLESRINSSVDLMNDHAGFIRGYCLAPLRPATERAKLMAGQS